MENGIGNPANGCPPLVGSEWVKNPGPGRIVRIISNGLVGPIEVAGKPYGTGTMLAVGNGLPGDEKEKARAIAAIASYVRKTFGSIETPLKAEQVQAVRAQIKDRTASFTAAELLGIAEKD
jgi:mono/diheme cytochrome c family protein